MLEVSATKRRGAFNLHAAFEAPTPGVVALFGRSGCGKTTLINIIAGLLEPDEGTVRLDGAVLADTRAGVSIPPERRRIGYVFQDARLFPHFNVLGNLRYGQKRAVRAAVSSRLGPWCKEMWRKRPSSCGPSTSKASPVGASGVGASPMGPSAMRPSPVGGLPPQQITLDEVISLLGLGSLLQRRPNELSGGERQRVALGRALLSQPQLLLLDEPLSGIDVARREEVLPYLELLRDRLSIPMVYVSHQFEEVLRLATYVVLMASGSVVARGSLAEISLRPELRAIVGPDAVGAVLDGTVTNVDSARGMADVQLGNGTLHVSLRGAKVGSRVRVQLLARDLILATESPHALSVRNALTGRVVELSEDDHEAVLVKVDIGGPTVLARITQNAVDALALRPGSPVWVLVKAVSTRGHAFRV